VQVLKEANMQFIAGFVVGWGLTIFMGLFCLGACILNAEHHEAERKYYEEQARKAALAEKEE
jgi:hypothetical protein